MTFDLVSSLSDLLRCSRDITRTFLYLLLCYPLSALYVYTTRSFNLPSWMKHLYFIVVGGSFMLFLFGIRDLFDFLVTSLPIYLLLKYTERFHEGKIANYASIGTFAWMLGNVSIYHYYRWIDSQAARMDLAVVTMLLTVKLTSAVHFQLDAKKLHKKTEKTTKQNESQNHLIHKGHTFEPLSLIEFLGYIFFFPGMCTGPVATLPEYRDFVSCASHNTELIVTASESWEHVETIPEVKPFVIADQTLTGLQMGLTGVLFIVLWKVGLPYFSHTLYMRDHKDTMAFHIKLIYLYVANVVARFKYYGAWYLSEGACIMIGAGFNKFSHTSATRWNMMQNIDVMIVETAPDFRTIVSHWNMKIAKWLHRDVFTRSLPSLGPTYANLLTYFVSALWHGTYPLYYLAFISASLISIAEKRIWKKYKTSLDPSTMSLPVRLLKTFITHCLLYYLTIAFLILDLKEAIAFWQSLYFFGHIVTFVILLITPI